MKHGIQHYSFIQASRFVFTTLLTGMGMGLSVSLVASMFVTGLHFLQSSSCYGGLFSRATIAGGSLVPMVWLICAAGLLWGIRRLFDITLARTADSIFGAHRLDNEIDVKAGVGSTIAAFVSLGGGASVGQYGPLVHFGATIGTYIRQSFKNITIGTDVFIGCGVEAAIAAGFHAPIAVSFCARGCVAAFFFQSPSVLFQASHQSGFQRLFWR